MLWSIDTFQNKVSTDQYHMTILWSQVESSSRLAVFFFCFSADQVLGFDWIACSSLLIVRTNKPEALVLGLAKSICFLALLHVTVCLLKCFGWVKNDENESTAVHFRK